MKKLLTVLMVVMLAVLVVGCKHKSTTNPGVNGKYTYTVATPGMPNNFNVHIWETNTDFLILTYSEMGLYDFILNQDKDGYEIVPEMAAGEPVDVTAQFAGNAKYGVPADATEGYAFQINLNQKATWENGTQINADTYVYSMQQLLNPAMQNYRADSYTNGTLVLAHAEDYLRQGQESYVTLGTYMSKNNITDLQAAITKATNDGLKTYINYVYSFGSMPDGSAAENRVVKTNYTLRELYDVYNDTATWADQSKRDSWVVDELYVEYTFPSLSFDNVGLFKSGDYQITLVLAKPITEFYLKYNLSSNWIVYKDLYEKGKEVKDGITRTNYGTSVDTYMAYGPYKLTTYQDDKLIALTRNDNWYGYTDGKHVGQFMATDISMPVIAEHNTELLSFLNGDLDEVALQATELSDYKLSENLVYFPESYSSKLTFNTDPAKLKARETAAGSNIDKEILANTKFREAISYALDRQTFVQTQTAGSQATLGLLNSQYISNVDTGEVYNTTKAFKDVVKRIYGTEFPTGYDVNKAKTLFQEAYTEQLNAGKIAASDKVQIEFLIYKNDPAYTDKVLFIQNALNAATQGTDLQGKIEFKQTVDEDYYNSAARGDFDCIWATWGGMTMDTFGFMQVYVDPDTMNEYGFAPKSETFTMTINGAEVTKTYYQWYTSLNDGEYSAQNADYNTRLLILAEMEYYILTQYRTIPVYSRTTLALVSDKIHYATTDFVPIVGFGGIRFMTFEMNDDQWNTYKENTIDYKD